MRLRHGHPPDRGCQPAMLHRNELGALSVPYSRHRVLSGQEVVCLTMAWGEADTVLQSRGWS